METLESPRGYLFRTAINLARDNVRQRRREYGAVVGPEISDVPSEEPTAYQVMKAEQELAIIRQAIMGLDPTCRRVFVMHRFEGLTYAQIADHFGLSVSMLEKHVSFALVNLKRCLDAASCDAPSRKVRP